MTKSLLVGLTGGIGSGKTTVAKIFKSLGVPIFNSDVEAKQIVNNNKVVINEITKAFGDVYLQNGLDSKKMAALVFNNPEALQKLNKIVHPQVKIVFDNWVLKHTNQPLLIKEAAILFETEAYKELDQTILVVAPQKMRIKRVMNRDHVSEKLVLKRIKNQLSDEKKRFLAQHVIVNDDKQLLIPQVVNMVNSLTE